MLVFSWSFLLVLIFVFLGSVESFSNSSKECTYDATKMCKPALMTAVYNTVAVVLGAIASVISGFLGMKIATYANARTTLEARKGVGKAFIVAFRSGAVMGFLLAANGLFVLYIINNLFKLYYGNTTAAIGKGFAIGSAALVSLALFGAFVSRAEITTVNVLTPKVFIGLLVGAILVLRHDNVECGNSRTCNG